MKNAEKKNMSGVPAAARFGGLFFVTYMGALVYFIEVSSGFWAISAAFFKALVWPGFLVHRVFELLKM